MSRLRHLLLVVMSVVVLDISPVAAAPPDANAYFEKKVRPLLVEKCWSCHGAEKQKGGLRLDSRAAMLTGGDRGPALIPSKPDESLIVTALRHDRELRMPPKSKLPDAEIAILTEWVKAGALWTDAKEAVNPTSKLIDRPFTAEEKAFWAFQPVKRPAVPSVAGAPYPIDAFLLSKLREKGLGFAPPADRRTLIRRVTFDFTGLPPTAAEVEAFIADQSPDAYSKLVERLLASPTYGEKWGRRWLDVVRYADSNGMDENLAHANAWRYRDWVIRSFNTDKSYDEFVREQITGDLIAGGTETERFDRLTATGFLVIGPKMLAEDDPVKMRMDIIDEQLDTLGQAFLGLTLGCARCHDHKFDPITSADYYGLAGMFYSTKSMRSYGVVAQWHERPVSPADVVAAAAEHDKVAGAERAVMFQAEKRETAAVVGVPVTVGTVSRQRGKLDALAKTRPPLAETMAVEDEKGQNLRVHIRGNHLTLGAEAPRRFPRIMAGDSALSLAEDRSGRLEFANWVASPNNSLTARVMANRIWAGHFGEGLVRSTDNFGRLGARPTHPELLDWLAHEFVKSRWSVKHMHRLIVTSAAYQSSYRDDVTAFQTDPENKLLWRFNRRRLDAEEVRDSMLATSGLLDRKIGGSLLTVQNRAYVTSTANRNYDVYSEPRRSVYLPVIRSAGYDVLQTFDFPDPSVPNGSRATTTIPTQALMLLNSPLADRTSEAFAKSLLWIPVGDEARIREAYRRALGRKPSEKELNRVVDYLAKSEQASDVILPPETRRFLAWRGFCRVLMASNEFAYVE